MFDKTARKLEFPKIIEKLMECCSFRPGKDLAEGLKVNTELAEAIKGQKETSEAKDVLRLYPLVPLGGLRDLRQYLIKVELGGVLQPFELLEIANTLNAGRRLKKFLSELPATYLLLQEQGSFIGIYKALEDKINRCIGDDGEVQDQASNELGIVRRQIRTLQGRIKERLDHIIRSTEFQKYLQDPIITVRDGRYVVPVKQEYRAQVPGLVHDQSASGATLFIEPMAVVEMANDLRRMIVKEAQEVERILRELSKEVEINLEQLTATLETLAAIDLIFAKGKLSALFDAGEPRLNKNGYVNIVKGRHPLISGRPVPVSLELGGEFDTLVITGPNTGGKTVTLKTVGLFCLMAAAGLHVPADDGTELCMFERVFVDIGDEQSIEQSLSTFSSHMTNIVEILNGVNNSSLVLLDEVGAGTDPTEGSALAMAILNYLQSYGAKTVATTHYSELKTFAYNNSRVENASVEFDVATLRPTYRLLIGTPGRSNAFEISGRLGLSVEVIAQARSYLSEQEMKVEDLLQNLEETQRATAGDREDASNLRLEVEKLRLELEEERIRLTNSEREVIEKASREAASIIRRARQDVDEVMGRLKEAATGEKIRLHAINEAKTKLSQFEHDVQTIATENKLVPSGKPLSKVQPGQTVEVPKYKQSGTVLKAPNAAGEVLVQVGMMKIKLRLDELRVGNAKTREVNSSGAGIVSKGNMSGIKQEFDLRGLMVDEAIYELDKYLDDAMLSGLGKVCIIHGVGTGALRAGIKEHLRGHPHVKDFRLGQYGEGGAGVSIVELK